MKLINQIAQHLAVNELIAVGMVELATPIALVKGNDEISDDAELLGMLDGTPGWNVETPDMIEWEDRRVRMYTAPIERGPIVVEIVNGRRSRDDQREWVQVAVLEPELPLGALVEILEAILVSQAR